LSLLRISAGIVSESKSRSGIIFRRVLIAASLQNASRSAPEYPWVIPANLSRFTFSDKGIPRVWISRISLRPFLLLIPISISRSNRPGLRNAGSNALTLFVAPITITFPRSSRPSIMESNWATTLRSKSPFVSSLFGAIESISSINMIEGESSVASLKIFRRFSSLSWWSM